MIVIRLKGGLGNQLFQVAAGCAIAKRTNRTLQLVYETHSTHQHTSLDYFDTLLRAWTPNRVTECSPSHAMHEPSYRDQPWETLIPESEPCVTVDGYFQSSEYVLPDFLSQLALPCNAWPSSSVFLHIRGGDYVGHPVHDVGLSAHYYPWAVQQFPPNTHFLVFTNDRAYAESLPFLQTISHSFAEGDELQALDQMRHCVGGICANSTFSWWGAYLTPNRKIVLPSKWFVYPIADISGLFVPGWTICPV